MLDVVHARQAAREVERLDIGADRADIGAHVSEMPDAQRQKLALLVERKLDLAERVARLSVAQERLRAGRHPVHRTAGQLSAHHDRDVFGIGAGLEPEGAADIVGEHPQLLLRPVHDAKDVVAQRAGALRTGAQRIAVVGGIVARGDAARLHRGDDEALIDHLDTRDVLGRGNHAFDLARISVRVGRKPGPVDRDIAERL